MSGLVRRDVVVSDGTRLSVSSCGTGPDVLVLSGGPGCVHYLANADLAPRGHRCWFPSPRGVAPSGGGPHDLARAIADLEDLRTGLGIETWTVLGHSWGSDLGVRYALDHPAAVRAVVGVAGHGLHQDRSWSEAYHAGRETQPDPVEIDWAPDVHAALMTSFREWIHEATLFRRIADCLVPIHVVIADADIRPDWPLRQLAALAPHGSLEVVDGAVHDFWATDPERWVNVMTRALSAA